MYACMNSSSDKHSPLTTSTNSHTVDLNSALLNDMNNVIQRLSPRKSMETLTSRAMRVIHEQTYRCVP